MEVKELEKAKEILNGFTTLTILDRNIFAMHTEQLKELQDNIRIILQELENSVSKDKIREKIAKLDKEEKDLQNSISDEEREEYSDASIGYALSYIEAKREILKELLGGEEMRDIKFRGQTETTKGKKWVYGYYYKVKSFFDNKEQGYMGVIRGNHLQDLLIDEDTLGQYTGLKDRNGKEIYEGDIVTGTEYPFIDEEKQNYIGIVVFYEDVAQFGYDYKCVRKDKRGISNGINNEFNSNENLICEDLEVIGNIYDNPELLEVE